MYEDLMGKPWNEVELPRELLLPRGMLGEEERRALWWLGRQAGGGAVIDAGSYLGASAFCLARGLAENERYCQELASIHSFDYFKAFDDYVASAITDSIRPCASGESYLDIFLWQTALYRGYIKPYPGDFLKTDWEPEPISICFIDIAKTLELSNSVICKFVPNMILNESIVIQQDFYHCWHPYMQIAMQYLKHRMPVIDSHILWQSRLYGLVSMPTAQEFSRIRDWDFSHKEEIDLLDEYINSERGALQAMAYVAALYRCLQIDELDTYRSRRRQMLAKFEPEKACDALWAQQYTQVNQLAIEKGLC